jgi:hypothetical protein
MDELFSCRNCIHNSAQTLLIGRGAGFCLMHKSVLKQPERTTCKYLARKDMPFFVVDEGVKEHAYEYASFATIVDMPTGESLNQTFYSEKHAWLTGTYDALTQILAHSYKISPTWVFVQSMAGGADGKRLLAHSSLVRRYMTNCGTWRSSYRFALSVIKEVSQRPFFAGSDLLEGATADEAEWDVLFARLSCIQEYGFHSGIDELMWATDHVNGALAALDLIGVRQELDKKSPEWVEKVIRHAADNGAFFPDRPHFDELENPDIE